MAERIVSPGVFTREKDLSFLPQAIGAIGPAIIGPTKSGPAFTPTVISSVTDFEDIFGDIGGDTDPYYTGIAAQRFLRVNGAPSITVVRVLGIGGYSVDAVNVQVGSGPQAGRVIATLLPSRKHGGDVDLSSTRISGSTGPSGSQAASASAASFLRISGSSLGQSFIPVNFNEAAPGLSTLPTDTANSVYVYKNFNVNSNMGNFGSDDASLSSSLETMAFNGATTFDANGNAGSWTGNRDFSFARTPYIISNKIGGGSATNLFRIYSRGHGDEMNVKFRVRIYGIQPAGTLDPDFATFTLGVMVQTDVTTWTQAETFGPLNFNPKSGEYAPAAIGDAWSTTDNQGKVTKYGQFGNKSKFIRMGDYSILPSVAKTVAPMGFGALDNPVPGGINVPTASFVSSSDDAGGAFSNEKYYGFDFATTEYAGAVNQSYLAPIPNVASVGANVTFSLEDQFGTVSGIGGYANSVTKLTNTSATNVNQRKFQVPFQWGFGGENPARDIKFGNDITANNSQGFDMTNGSSSGSVAYKKALGTIADPDFIDINMLVTPGVIHEYHSSISSRAMNIATNRGDCFYIMDGSRWGRSVTNAVTDISGVDNNYVATYFPWVSISNPGSQGSMWVPPSAVMAGVFSSNDQIGQEWFAPAGLNRGGIDAQDVKTVLSHTDRDELYLGRVNPIAQFPNQGIVAFGQKTLQARPSALDRINVRRLLINLKKFIASSSRFLVFEANNSTTRNRFLNIVNPYMESVQQRSGLSAFRVVMDDSNNTPDVVDRNQLVGQIFVQPTRTAEFIVLDFVVLPTGAAFPE